MVFKRYHHLVQHKIGGGSAGGRGVDLKMSRAGSGVSTLRGSLADVSVNDVIAQGVWETALAERQYAPYIVRQRNEIRRQREMGARRIPDWVDYSQFESLRPEAREALARFQPDTFRQAGRLEGVTPADLTLLSVLIARGPGERDASAHAEG